MERWTTAMASRTRTVCAGNENGGYDVSVVNFILPGIIQMAKSKGHPGPCKFCPVSDVMCLTCYQVFDSKLVIDASIEQVE